MLPGDTRSLSTLASSSSAIHASPSRRIIDHLALNTDFSGMKSNISKSSSLSAAPTKSSTSSLSSTGTTHSLNITSSHSQRKIESMQNISTLMNNSKDSVGGVKERLITKIDPVEMTVKPTIVTVLQDTVKRSAMLLAGPKFRLNMKEIQKTKLPLNSDTIYSISVSILENLRVVSIDLGKTFPIILKIEPMQWNTQGIWFNLFLYYRGNFKLSIKSRVVLQKLINYDPKNDKPIFAQHQTSQIVHKDNENIDENDLIQRQKLLAKEPEIPEMAVTRKFGTALTNLALNKYFQMFVNLPFVKTLFEKFSQQDVGIDVELTSFSGILTLNIPPPPSDRIWVGFPEMPDLNIKVTPTYGEKQYSYILLQDFLAAKVRAELKRLVVLPAMDDQLLPFFRDWVIDIIGNIVAKPINQLTDNYKAKLNIQTAVREGLQEYKNVKNVKRQSPVLSTGSETTRTQM
ncbi:unnamed protein product [Rotaria sp. Silwood1]|nr:unnamed protein product [Rotaria sp. Silwood1]